MVLAADTRPLEPQEQDFAVKTWRYLRLAMVGLAFGLAIAIAYEWGQVHHDCFQESISAYYYTPARGYLVAALVGIGVCLFCLKGSSEVEDVLLNIAGMCAPVVALVPTPDHGTCTSERVALAPPDDNIANNITALLGVGFAAVLLLVVLALATRRERPTRTAVAGFALAVLLLVATAIVFWADRAFFDAHAHKAAAGLMFVCIALAVLINALAAKQVGHRRRPVLYLVIAVAMFGAMAGLLIRSWPHRTIVVEAALIALFAAFWIVQTADLWYEGLRPDPDADGPARLSACGPVSHGRPTPTQAVGPER